MQLVCCNSFKPKASARLMENYLDSDWMLKVRFVLLRLIAILLLAGACASVSDSLKHPTRVATSQETASAEESLLFWDSCNPEQAERWAAKAEGNGRAALMAAHCYAALIRQGDAKSVELEHARNGRRLAEAAVKMFPESGTAHYLAAYLTGLQAERDPLRGLDLVPIIEREALSAADLNPAVDRGGPDRMLGELYLRAPGFPLSVGDSRKAVLHFQRALNQAPDFYPNRQGLVEALLAEGMVSDACRELSELFASIPPASEGELAWREALKLLDQFCSKVVAE